MGLEKSAARVVDELWARVAAHDWAKVGHLLSGDVVVEWPAESASCHGRNGFVSVLIDYPEGWSVEVQAIVEQGGTAVSEVEVEHESLGTFRAVSFWTVRDGLITTVREYWTAVGDAAPAVRDWRAPYATRAQH